MSVQHPERIVTKQDLKDFYDGILPYLGGITVDSALSSTSENPVQNKVVTEAINDINSLTTAQKNALIALLN